MSIAMEAAAIGLENGDVMSRAEFHRRYSQCPDLHRVELIEGVVYMPSPIRFKGHGREQALILHWLLRYTESHEGVEAVGPATVLLDDENEPEPDAMLFRVTEERFEDDYIKGPPELIAEIAGSSRARLEPAKARPKKAPWRASSERCNGPWRSECSFCHKSGAPSGATFGGANI